MVSSRAAFAKRRRRYTPRSTHTLSQVSAVHVRCGDAGPEGAAGGLRVQEPRLQALSLQVRATFTRKAHAVQSLIGIAKNWCGERRRLLIV